MVGKLYTFSGSSAALHCSATKLRSAWSVWPTFIEMHGSSHLIIGVVFVSVYLFSLMMFKQTRYPFRAITLKSLKEARMQK